MSIGTLAYKHATENKLIILSLDLTVLGDDGESQDIQDILDDLQDQINGLNLAVAAAIAAHLKNDPHDPAIDQYNIPTGETVTVPENRQRFVKAPVTIDGTLVVDGQEVLA